MNTFLRYSFLAASVSLLLGASDSLAAGPASETILPNTTKLFLSIPQPDLARKQFDATQLGALVNHEEMKPFTDDLEKQLEGRGRLAERLGIAIGELDEIYGGEMALAVIRPASEKDGFATALIVDVTGHESAATEMLAKVRERRRALAPGQVKTPAQMFGTRKGMSISVPADKAKKRPAITSYYFFVGKQLVACDHLEEAQNIYKRLVDGGGSDSLANFAPYVHSMKEVQAASKDIAAPHVKWFTEPLGYQRVRRAEQIADGTRVVKRGETNQIDVYEREGFDAVQGIGGWVNFAEKDHEVIHRTLVYAPEVDRTAKDKETLRRLTIEKKTPPDKTIYEGPANDKYLLGMRLFHFFNTGPIKPLAWLTDDVATHLTFNWYTQRAFKYSETLMNARSDEVDTQAVWADTLDSIRDDVDGPKVDVRSDIVLQLGTHTTQVTDFLKPVTPESERTVLIFQIKGDVAKVDKAITRMMEVEMEADGAKKHVVGDHVIWQLLPLAADDDRGGRDEDEEERLMPPASFCVAHGCLLRGSHPDIIERLLKDPPAKLVAAADLAAMQAELDALSDGDESFRYFDRLDRSLEAHWELFRVGRFPQATSMLSNLVARMQGYDTDDPETRKRKQEIDASKLPKFPFAVPFLGPSGMIAKTRDDGWLVTGVVLKK